MYTNLFMYRMPPNEEESYFFFSFKYLVAIISKKPLKLWFFFLNEYLIF